MKKLFPLFVCLLLFSCAEKKKVKNDLTRNNYKGSVKSVCDRTYMAYDTTKVEKGKLMNIDSDKYNPAGYEILYNNYLNGKQLNHQGIYKYDSHNNIIEEDRFDLNLYDTSQPLNVPVTKIYKYTYKFNDEGNITRKIVTINDVFDERVEYTLDDDGQEIENKEYHSGDSLFAQTKNIYGPDGSCIEKDIYRLGGKVTDKSVIFYDDKGNEQQILRYKGDSLESKVSFQYDDKGNNTDDLSYGFIPGEQLPSVRHRVYNSFDSKGNWLSMTFYARGNILWIEERTIEYY